MIILRIKNIAGKWVGRLGDSLKIRRNRYMVLAAVLLVLASLAGYGWVCNNEAYYKQTIAKITSVTETEDSPAYDTDGNPEEIDRQEIEAVIMNGVYRGEKIHLQNETSYSKAYDLRFQAGDEVFVSITVDAAGRGIVSAQIIDLKRDRYLAYIAILFILLILLVGGRRGFRSLVSVVVNIVLFSIVIALYFRGYDLILLSVVASVFFIVISISLVGGISQKTGSAVIGTMAGTLLSMLITVAVIMMTRANGLYYEEMEFMARAPEPIFMAEVLVGTLGGIMDIAVSISSAVKELCDENPGIERKVLLRSGREIGKDIMGTMANTLVFAYISGSIPMILLWLKNGFSPFEIVKINLSLEIVRALTGSIGIVMSIPITLYISVLFLKKNKLKEA